MDERPARKGEEKNHQRAHAKTVTYKLPRDEKEIEDNKKKDEKKTEQQEAVSKRYHRRRAKGNQKQ
jgi:hypothetical protein